MNTITTYEVGTTERGVLEYFASIFNAEMEKAGDNRYMTVRDIYFDYSQDWWYTSPIVNDGDRSWQALNPRDYEALVKSDSFSVVFALALDFARAILEGKISVHLTF